MHQKKCCCSKIVIAENLAQSVGLSDSKTSFKSLMKLFGTHQTQPLQTEIKLPQRIQAFPQHSSHSRSWNYIWKATKTFIRRFSFVRILFISFNDLRNFHLQISICYENECDSWMHKDRVSKELSHCDSSENTKFISFLSVILRIFLWEDVHF